MDARRIPRAGVLASAFFVASLIRSPIGPTYVHLVLNGMVGVLLGWVAVPAILASLVLQALLFQVGGFTTLGVNTVIMALPAVLAAFVTGPMVRSRTAWVSGTGAFLAGSGAVALSAVLMGGALLLSGDGFREVAEFAVVAHLPVIGIEGLLTVMTVGFLRKVRPEMLEKEAWS
jgi:cobalt/nickel transport system permease protein